MSKRVTRKTFLSICSPVDDMTRVMGQISLLRSMIRDLFYRYVPSIRTLPFKQGLTFEPTWKSLPTFYLVSKVLVQR